MEIASQLIAANGYAGTSLGDICAAASVTKGAFFHHFESKEAMAEAIIDDYFERIMGFLETDGFLRLEDPVARVHGYLDATKRMLGPGAPLERGCLLGTLTQEVALTRPKLQQRCDGCFERWSQLLTGLLKDAKAAVGPGAPWSPKDVADHFIVVIEGATLMARGRPGTVDPHIEHFRVFVSQLLNQE